MSPRPRTWDEAWQIIRDLVRDRYDGWDEQRWQVARTDDMVIARVPYGAPSLKISQQITIDLGSGELQSFLAFPSAEAAPDHTGPNL